MKKTFLLWVTALFLFSALLVSCSPAPLTADQVIQKLADNGRKLKTGHIQMDMKMSAGDQTLEITSSGIFENPDKSYLTVSVMGQSLQVLSLSVTEVYRRASETDAWVKSIESDSGQTGSMYDFTKNPEQLLKYYKNAKLLPDASVEGCPSCYHVTFELDVAEMMKAGGVDAVTLQSVEFKGPALVDAWISKTDFFTRKQTSKFIIVSSGAEVAVDMKVVLTEINQPVVLPTP